MKFNVLSTSYLRPVGSPDSYIFKPGEVYEGPEGFQPGPHLDPIDDEAKAAMAAYVKKFPHASLHPVEQLPATVGGARA